MDPETQKDTQMPGKSADCNNTNTMLGDLNTLSCKVEEQSEVIKLVLTQIDVQNEKLSKHENLIQNLLTQIEDLQTRIAQKEKSDKVAGNVPDWTTNKTEVNSEPKILSIAEMAKQTAEETMAKSGFVYDEASGLYLDYASGYYYDPVQSLYYNGHTGIYYTYDSETQKYVFHSQAELPTKRSTSKQKQRKGQKKTAVRNTKPEIEKTPNAECPPKSPHYTGDSDNTNSKDGNNIDEVDPHADRKSPSQLVESKKNRSVVSKSDDDIEEGEISSSMGSPASCHENDSDCSTITSESEQVADNFPPCIRAIVLESDIENLKKGHLFIVTCTGGSIGSDGAQHSILIPDENVDKHHADILYIEENSGGQYMIKDRGSRLGTFLNGSRLSEPNEESQLSEILHGSKLIIGNTSLLLHIHPGSFTCGHCEPGLLIEKEPQDNSRFLNTKRKEAQRRSEMRKLQKKYGVGPIIPDKLSSLPESYQDRAERRRLTKGSDNPFEKTEVASADQALKESNKGFKMMAKMGWKEGTSLGNPTNEGIKEPIQLNIKADRRGLGSANFPQVPLMNLSSTAKKEESVSDLKNTSKSKPEAGGSRAKTSRAEILDKTFKRFKECLNEEDPK